MVLYMIGLGLGDADDITVKGLKLVQSADLLFLESYTSLFPGTSANELEQAYGLSPNSLQIADRDLVEQHAEERILQPALTKKVAFLVVGDPVSATTHSDLWLRAHDMGIDVQVVHNTSIMGGPASACGALQLYKFGQTISIPLFEDGWKPTASFYDKIESNLSANLHTLCLLDIKVKEPDFKAMMKGKTGVYLPPRFMTVPVAARQLVEAESIHGRSVLPPDSTLCVGLARMGNPTSQCVLAGTLKELAAIETDDVFGGPLHSLVICGELHELEWEVLKRFLMNGSKFDYQACCEKFKQKEADGKGETTIE